MMQQDVKSQLTTKEQTQTLMRLIRYTFPFKKLIFLTLAMLTFSTMASMSVPYLVKMFIDQYLTPQHFPRNEITILLVVFVAVELIGAVTTYLSIYYLQYLAFKVIQQLRIDAFHNISQLGMKFFDETPSGSIVSRLTNDTEAIVEMFTGVLSSFLIAFFMIIASFVMMFVLDIRMAFFAMLFIPIVIVVLAIYRKYASIYFYETRQRLSDLNAKLGESIEGMKIIQVFNQERRLRNEFEAINASHYQYSIKTIRLDGLLLRPAITMLSTFAIVVILAYFGILSFSTTVTAGVVYAFI